MALLLAPLWPGELVAAADYGRWQPSLRGCSMVEPLRKEQSCQLVLLDQLGVGVYRVRWSAIQSRPSGSRQLTFVGLLIGGSKPMACRQALCRLQGPITLAISNVGTSVFGGNGVAGALPDVRPAAGQCRLAEERIHCEARAPSGELWSAEAQPR